MKTRGLRAILILATVFACVDAEGAPTLDICGKLYDIYGAFSERNYTEEQQKEYYLTNLEGKQFQLAGIVKDVGIIKNGVRLHLDQDRCVSVFADSLSPGQCELNYMLSLKKGDQVTMEGNFFCYSASSSAVVKLNDAKVLSSTCNNQINAEQNLEAKLQNPEINDNPIRIKSKNDCPEDLLSAGSVKGMYLGTTCVDYCFSTIKLSSGKEISIMCEDDEADAYFGEETGQDVEINYDIVQFWNQYEGKCQLTTVCKSGKALTGPTGRTN